MAFRNRSYAARKIRSRTRPPPGDGRSCVNHRLGSLALGLLVLLGACAAPDADPPVTNAVRVSMTDAPLHEATGLMVSFGRVDLVSSSPGAGVVTVTDAAGRVDVLGLANGVTATIGEVEVPDGTYAQVRLVIDDATLAFGDDTFDVVVPSGEETGLKIDLEPPLVVSGGEARELVIDFDVHRGVVETPPGSDRYRLVPTALRAFSEAAAVAGEVVALGTGDGIENVRVDVFAAGSLDLVTTTYSEADGSFAFGALLAGLYDLRFEATGYEPLTVTDVTATAGVPLDLGLIDLTPLP